MKNGYRTSTLCYEGQAAYLREKGQAIRNPFNREGIINIGINTLSNYSAGKLGDLLGTPKIRINTSTDLPNIFGPALNTGANIGGNAAGDAVTNTLIPEKPEKK